MAASSSRLIIVVSDDDTAFEEFQPELSDVWAPPQEPGFGVETLAGPISTPKAEGNEVPISPVRQARAREPGQEPDGSQEPDVACIKYRKLDPKSQKDLDEQTFTLNAMSSSSGDQAAAGDWRLLGGAKDGELPVRAVGHAPAHVGGVAGPGDLRPGAPTHLHGCQPGAPSQHEAVPHCHERGVLSDSDSQPWPSTQPRPDDWEMMTPPGHLHRSPTRPMPCRQVRCTADARGVSSPPSPPPLGFGCISPTQPMSWRQP